MKNDYLYHLFHYAMTTLHKWIGNTKKKLIIYALNVQDLFFWRGGEAALSKLISQMVMYLHTGSHVKPWRVKTHMQMRANKKNIKKKRMSSFSLLILHWTRIGQRRSGGQFKERKEKRIIKYWKEVLASDCGLLQLGDTVATRPSLFLLISSYLNLKNYAHILCTCWLLQKHLLIY